jgi:hypothetical protein
MIKHVHDYNDLKRQMLELLTDADLANRFPHNPSLGELCKEMGETQQSYLNSFKTTKLNFSYRNPDAALATSVAALAAWYANLDAEMDEVLAKVSEDDLQATSNFRGNWEVTMQVNLEIYLQALMIFAGKAWVHLLALGKTLPEQWADWIGEA